MVDERKGLASQIKINPEMAVMLLLYLWLWLLQIVGKAHTMHDPFYLPYEYYQTGDLIIGAIATMAG